MYKTIKTGNKVQITQTLKAMHQHNYMSTLLLKTRSDSADWLNPGDCFKGCGKGHRYVSRILTPLCVSLTALLQRPQEDIQPGSLRQVVQQTVLPGGD